jgi:fructose-bisphosphate aldolase class II
MKPLLAEAASRGTAVGSFNVYSRETVRGAVNAAVRSSEPIILAFGAAYLEQLSFEEIAGDVRRAAGAAAVPAALHLDHCRDLDVVRAALDSGFTSVMYDGSALPFAENVRKTAEAVRLAAAYGASVEGELGSLAAGAGTNEGSAADIQLFTDPGQAERFAAETGVDALAVSIGTVHGFYKAAPDIRIDILAAIGGRTRVPLVLHGGSGTPERILIDCIRSGIRKINVNTELSAYTVSGLGEAIKENPSIHLSRLASRETALFEEIVSKYIELFGLRARQAP